MAAIAASPLCAQSTGEEIVVTAQRRSERLLDVPMAVDAFGAPALEDAGVAGLGDLGMVAPGLSVDDATGYLLVHLRGVGSISTGAGVENAVALYVDGIYHGNQSIGAARFNDVERVELLKGPQGTLFGRNATGGLIHIITEDPGRTTKLRASLSVGNHDEVESRFSLSGPITDDVSAGVAFRFGRNGAFGENLVNGRGIHGVRRDFAVRSKLLYRPGPARLTIIADYADKAGSDSVLALVEGSRPFASAPPVSYPDPWDARNDRQPRLRQRMGGLSARGELTLGGIEISETLAWRRAFLDDEFDYDGSEFPLVAAHIRQEDRQFSSELQLRSVAGKPLGWIAGAYYFDAASRLDPQTVDLANDPLFNPDLPLVRLVTRGRQVTRSIALYAQGDVEIGRRLRLTAGARFTSERRSIDSKVDGILSLPGSPMIPVTPRTRASRRFGRPTWRLAVDYHPSDEAILFASAATGFKSGGFNVAEPESPFFRSEDLIAFEAGGKWRPARGRLEFDASAFHYAYRHLQVLRAGQTSTGFSSGPSARINGFEAEARWKPIEGLALSASVALLKARYGRFTDALVGQPGGGVPLVPGDASGNRVPFSPRAAFSLSARYSRPIGPNLLVLDATYSHRSRTVFEPDNVVPQPATGLLNLTGRIELRGGRRWISLFGRNLTDQAVTRAALTIPSGQQIRILHPPRSFGLEVGVRY